MPFETETRRTGRRRVDRTYIVEKTRESPNGSVTYTAHFNRDLSVADPEIQQMAFFARRIGSGLVLHVGDLQFGFKTEAHLGYLTKDEANEFTKTFKPDEVTVIPVLEP